jgi:ABC-type glycerol-3-phosphate transport system substrate-binding protein
MMVVSLVLTSCSDEKTDDEIRKENVCAGDTAYTLSLWIPTNSDTTSEAFQKRLEAVEAEINALIATKNTKIEIVAVSDAEYDSKLMQKFSGIKASQLVKPIEIGKNYVNDAEK